MLNDIGPPDEIKRVGPYLLARFPNGISHPIHTKVSLTSFSADACNCNDSLLSFEGCYLCKHTVYLRGHQKSLFKTNRLGQILSQGASKKELIYSIVALATAGKSEQRLIHFLDKSTTVFSTNLYTR